MNFPVAPAPTYDSVQGEINEVLERIRGGGNVGVNRTRRRTQFPMDLCISIKLALSFTGNKNRCLGSGCGFQEMARLEKIHPTVRKLADIYIEQCASSNKALSGSLRDRPVTLGERVRIERAFYRFEIFRRAFGSFEGRWDNGPFRGVSDNFANRGGDFDRDFFDNDANRDRDWLDNPVPNFIQDFKESFNTVELIQLHSIYGFLKRLITPAINDMLWHDCEMHEWRLVGDWASDERVSAHVFAGMQHVYDVWAAFKARNVTKMCCLIQMEADFGFRVLHVARKYDTALYHVLAAELYTGRKSSLEVTKSKIAIHDTDEGPRDACLAVSFAIRDMGKQSPYQLRHEQDGLAPHRQWGFVMWDHRRLNMMGFFERPFASPIQRSPYLTGDLNAASVMFRQHIQTLRQGIQARAPLGGRWQLGSLIWWEGVIGSPYTLGPRDYDTWYPLAAPES